MEAKTKQALYRRYRSMSFDELVGQEHVTDLLKAAVKNGTFSHAYLFTGQRGTGKTSAARILAYAINDLPYDADSGHLDIIEIDAASNRRIDDIRDLREKVFIAPVSAKYKVYIIDEVHMLTGESFNALLKTLEEPPAHTVFILATTELHKVPATIISRTQRFHFRPVPMGKVVSHLAMIAKKESIDIDEDALKLIAEHGGGSFRDSISLLDQIGSLREKITTETVELVLGRARGADIARIISLLENGDQNALHAQLESMLAGGTSPVTLAEQLVSTLLTSPQGEKRWYDLIEKLMSVPKAHFPQLLLVSTLLGFTSKEEDGKKDGVIAKKTEKQNPPKSEPLSTSAVLTNQGESGESSLRGEDQPEGPTKGSSAAAKDDSERTTLREEAQPKGKSGELATMEWDWDNVLTAVKKTNPALHAVLSRATAEFADNTLTLIFQYALHRKKLEQQLYQSQLSRTIHDVCGINPKIVIEGTSPQLASDDTTKKVADLMGGGESVTV